jgi:hypothetical protein
VSSPIQIAMPSTAMSIDEQRHRLMQDMLTMQSRLLGEQRVLQEIMQDSAEKVLVPIDPVIPVIPVLQPDTLAHHY